MRKNLLDLHTHSVLSRHAYSSLTENIEQAAEIGLKYYGISEHQPDSENVGAHKYAFKNCFRICPKVYKGTNILIGIELNILDNGFNLEGLKPEDLSYAIASMHTYVYSDKHCEIDNTNNYLYALDQPYITFLGHMDNPKFKCDYEKVIKRAKENHKLIEMNNESLDPIGSRVGAKDIDKIILDLCKQYRVPIIMNSDAHIKYQVGEISNSIRLLDEVNFPDELVVNYNEDLFNEYFK